MLWHLARRHFAVSVRRCACMRTLVPAGVLPAKALRSASAAACAAALFAVGWPYEGDCGSDASPCWQQRDDAFWAGIQEAWREGTRSRPSGTVGSTAAGAAAAGAPAWPRLQLPFYTNFCQGSGRAFFQTGRMCSSRPWYNLSLQCSQPLLPARQPGELAGSGGSGGTGAGTGTCEQSAACVPLPLTTAVCGEHAFSGGSCLRLCGTLRHGQRATVQLFEPAVELPAEGIRVRLTASLAGEVALHLALHLSPAGATQTSDDVAAGGGRAAQATGTWVVTLTPRFGAAEAATAETALPGEPTLEADGVGRHALAALSAGVGRRTAALSPWADGGGSGDSAAATSGAAAATPDWQTFHFSLGPEVLAGAGMLIAVELLLVGASVGNIQGSESSCGHSNFTACLGERSFLRALLQHVAHAGYSLCFLAFGPGTLA